jgi:hypothetical protein
MGCGWLGMRDDQPSLLEYAIHECVEPRLVDFEGVVRRRHTWPFRDRLLAQAVERQGGVSSVRWDCARTPFRPSATCMDPRACGQSHPRQMAAGCTSLRIINNPMVAPAARRSCAVPGQMGAGPHRADLQAHIKIATALPIARTTGPLAATWAHPPTDRTSTTRRSACAGRIHHVWTPNCQIRGVDVDVLHHRAPSSTI